MSLLHKDSRNAHNLIKTHRSNDHITAANSAIQFWYTQHQLFHIQSQFKLFNQLPTSSKHKLLSLYHWLLRDVPSAGVKAFGLGQVDTNALQQQHQQQQLQQQLLQHEQDQPRRLSTRHNKANTTTTPSSSSGSDDDDDDEDDEDGEDGGEGEGGLRSLDWMLLK